MPGSLGCVHCTGPRSRELASGSVAVHALRAAAPMLGDNSQPERSPGLDALLAASVSCICTQATEVRRRVLYKKPATIPVRYI